MIYLACPYANDDPLVKLARVRAASRAAAQLMHFGFVVFSPLTHAVQLTKFLPDKDHAFWMKQDIAVLKHCETLYVLPLPGWRESKGVQEEIAVAEAMNIAVVFINPHGIGQEVPKLDFPRSDERTARNGKQMWYVQPLEYTAAVREDHNGL